MKQIGTVLKIVWKAWFITYMLISTIIFYAPLVLSILILKNYNLTYRIYRVWAWTICLAIGIIPKVQSKHNLPKDSNFILVANHTSELDIILPYTFIPNHFAFLAKEELAKLPLFSINFKGMNVTVNRQKIRSGLDSLHECTAKLKSNVSLLIFPEGTRSKNAPAMRNFKNGTFKLAIQNQVDIVPIAFLDNYKRLQGGKGFFNGSAGPGVSRAIVLPAISTKGLTNDDVSTLSNQVRNALQEVLN